MLNVSDTEIGFFKADVVKFTEIDSEIKKIKKQIKPLQDKIKELTKLKQEKEAEVISFMSSNELDACNTDDASFEVKSSKTTKPITKGDIYDRIFKFFSEEIKKVQTKDPEELAKTLHNYIYVENREKDEKKVLKSK